MEKYKNFFYEYRGAFIGAVIAILVMLTGLYKLIVGIILVVIFMLLGNYIQRNKTDVKEKLKAFIDRI